MDGGDGKIIEAPTYRGGTFMGASVLFRLGIAAACLGALWLGVLWALT